MPYRKVEFVQMPLFPLGDLEENLGDSEGVEAGAPLGARHGDWDSVLLDLAFLLDCTEFEEFRVAQRLSQSESQS